VAGKPLAYFRLPAGNIECRSSCGTDNTGWEIQQDSPHFYTEMIH
jgi:hypothetical protein